MKARQYLRSALAILAIIGVLLIGAGAVARAYFDAAQIKRELARLVLEKTQRTLNIDGDLSLSFWPGIGIRLGHTTLSEHASAQPFASLDAARLTLQIRPLLSRQLVIDGIELTGLKATLVRHPDGSLNIADLLRHDTPDRSPLNLDIAGIRIEQGELAWRDAQSHQAFTLGALQLQTGQLASALDGSLQLHDLHLTARCCAGSATLTDWDLQLQARQIHAGLDADITDLQLTARTQRGNDQLALGLATPRLQLAAAHSSASTLTLTANRAGLDQQAQLKLDLTGLETRAQALQIARGALTLAAQGGPASSPTTLKGAFDSPLTADLATRTLDLPRITGTLAITSAQLSRQPLHLPLTMRLHADLAQQNATGQLSAQLDTSHLAAGFSLSRFAPLALRFNVDIDQLDLDQYLPPLPPKSAGRQERAGNPDNLLDLSALRNVDLHGVVNLGALQMAGIRAQHLRLDIQSGNGEVRIAPPGSVPLAGSAQAASHNDQGHIRITQGKVN